MKKTQQNINSQNNLFSFGLSGILLTISLSVTNTSVSILAGARPCSSSVGRGFNPDFQIRITESLPPEQK